MGTARALGTVTRGTTNPNRLRRNDNWITAHPAIRALLAGGDPGSPALVIDLGYGSSAVTTIELAARIRRRIASTAVLGLEIDPARVAVALPFADPPLLDFAVGGFELAGRRPQLVRAMNVLRQYSEEQAYAAWGELRSRLAPGGLIVEGTCNEIGRVGSWVLLDEAGPLSLTLSCAPEHLDSPATLAERLPKTLIHHNLPGHPIHRLLADLTAGWDANAGLAVFSTAQRFAAAAASLAAGGWQLLDGSRQHRRGQLTVGWDAVAG